MTRHSYHAFRGKYKLIRNVLYTHNWRQKFNRAPIAKCDVNAVVTIVYTVLAAINNDAVF
jgi:hypothetical protein